MGIKTQITFWYKKSPILFIAVVIFLFVVLPALIVLALQNMNTSGTDYYGRKVATLKLFGQKSLSGATRIGVTPNAAYHGSGVIVDTSSTPNKLYYVDSGNNRILGFNVADGSDRPADIVIGQPSMNVGDCNGDSNLGFKKSPTAATLCLTGYPSGNNTAEQWAAINIDVDSQGNLYVPDSYNNRVLEYYQPFSADKTGGKGDSIADVVYGQPDFTTNKPNGGDINKAVLNPPVLNPPTPNILSICCGYGSPTATGVGVDPVDNGVWVADTRNGRVLHFPQGSQNSDVILGTKKCDQDVLTATAGMCSPIAVRVNPDTRELYVIDNQAGFNARFMVFVPDGSGKFTTGQNVSRVFLPKVPRQAGVNDAWFDTSGKYIFRASGFEFNRNKADYPNGVIWLNEHEKSRTVLLDATGAVVATLHAKDVYHRGGDIAYNGCPQNIYSGDKVGWPNGSIGQDSNNNLYFADEWFGRVVRYASPYRLTSTNGTVCPPEGNASYLQRGWNVQTSDTLGETTGIVTFGNQLIVADQNLRYKVWNDYMNKPMGAPADYIISTARPRGGFFSGGIDGKGRLWTQGEHGQIQIYQLPFTKNDQAPAADWVPIYWSDDGQQLSGGGDLGSRAVAPDGRTIYIAQGARILKTHYDETNNKVMIDAVIGQVDKVNNNCNQGRTRIVDGQTYSAPTAETFCQIEQIKFDKVGNLYVVDDTFECHGNRRMTVLMADDLQNVSSMFPNLSAKIVFNAPSLTALPEKEGVCAYWITGAPGTPVTVAFNSKNQLVIGNDGYYGDISQREVRQLWFYATPLTKQTPDAAIDLYMGTPGDIAFDKDDNLVVRDGTWYRAWVINPFDIDQNNPSQCAWLADPVSGKKLSANAGSCATPQPPAQTITNTPTITPTTTITPTITTTSTPTPTRAPTSTSTPTPTLNTPPQGLSSPTPGTIDTIPPVVTIATPLDGASIQKYRVIQLIARATDNTGIKSISISVDNKVIKNCLAPVLPYTCSLYYGFTAGTHVIKATALDIASPSNVAATSISVTQQ